MRGTSGGADDPDAEPAERGSCGTAAIVFCNDQRGADGETVEVAAQPCRRGPKPLGGRVRTRG